MPMPFAPIRKCGLFLVFTVLFSGSVVADTLRVSTLENSRTAGTSQLVKVMWKSVAEDLHVSAHVGAAVGTASVALSGVERQHWDVFIGPYVQAESNPALDFVSTHVAQEFGILRPTKDPGVFERMWPLLRAVFGATFSGYFLIMLGVATLIWFFERKHNAAQFPANPIRGIGNGLWYTLVTMTTVGYGDRVPKSFEGRLVASVWMLLTLVFVSTVTVLVTAELASVKLSSAPHALFSDLRDQQVGYVAGDWRAKRLILGNAGHPRPFESLEKLAHALVRHELPMGIVDRIETAYLIRENRLRDVHLGEVFKVGSPYVFVMRRNDPRLPALQDTLFRLESSGVFEHLRKEAVGAP